MFVTGDSIVYSASDLAAAPGAMVAVALGPDDVTQYLPPEVELSAVNDPGN
ncbi:hypothetical protein GR254_04245, partial [Mycobacterium tuberculosis]|nr:hypothetical protein [Mycobacterium tuberculosis]